MSGLTPDKVELSSTQTRNWVLLGIVTFLVLLVQGFFTYIITTTGAEVRETNRTLNEMVTTVKVQQVQQEYLREQVSQLQAARKEATDAGKAHDTRLSSIEQRLALHDQWITTHNP